MEKSPFYSAMLSDELHESVDMRAEIGFVESFGFVGIRLQATPAMLVAIGQAVGCRRCQLAAVAGFGVVFYR